MHLPGLLDDQVTSRADELVADLLRDDGDGSAEASLPGRLCRDVVAAVGVTGVGLALMDERGVHAGLVAASDASAEAIEELQFGLGEGPCVEASRERRPVLVSEFAVRGPARWPLFGPAVTLLGVRAAFAFPLQVGGIRLGVLDLYRDAAGSLTDRGLAEALAYSDVALRILLHMQETDQREGGPSPLTRAFDDRAVVHQATGMISRQLGLSLTQALLRLRAHSYADGRVITELASDVVHRRVRFDDSIAGTAPGSP